MPAPVKTAPVQAIAHIRGGRIVDLFPALFLNFPNEVRDDGPYRARLDGFGFKSSFHATQTSEA